MVCLSGISGLWGRDVVWFGALQDLPLGRIGVRCPFFLSFFGCWDVRRRRFSLSFSLRCWGTTNPCGVCVSLSVSSSWTRTPTSTRTSSFSPSPRLRPAPVFFSVAGSVFSRFCLVGVGFLGGCFSVSLAVCVGFLAVSLVLVLVVSFCVACKTLIKHC